MKPNEAPPEFRIWQLSLGFANTTVLYALVKTGVIEQMRQQPQSLADLAQACGLNPDVLYRVLRFASVIGIVRSEEGQYDLTETGRLLLKDVPGSMYFGILLFGSEPWLLGWHNLDASLSSGEVAFEKATGDQFFPYIDKHPEVNSTFNQWMTVSAIQAAKAIPEAYDFTPFNSLCDIGGGQGILLKNILIANPHLHGILYDQESVVKDHVLSGMDGRVEIQSGSFFDRVPSADVLLMKSVLHDWSDEKCKVILNNCRQSMQPSSRLLIIDRVISSPTNLMDAFFDLHMQVIAGGRERTEGDFNSLLQKAGMKLNRILPTKTPWMIVEAALA